MKRQFGIGLKWNLQKQNHECQNLANVVNPNDHYVISTGTCMPCYPQPLFLVAFVHLKAAAQNQLIPDREFLKDHQEGREGLVVRGKSGLAEPFTHQAFKNTRKIMDIDVCGGGGKNIGTDDEAAACRRGGGMQMVISQKKMQCNIFLLHPTAGLMLGWGALGPEKSPASWTIKAAPGTSSVLSSWNKHWMQKIGELFTWRRSFAKQIFLSRSDMSSTQKISGKKRSIKMWHCFLTDLRWGIEKNGFAIHNLDSHKS